MKLSKEELIKTTGGISSTFINSMARMINVILELGQILGSSIRRKKEGKYCNG